MKKTLEILASGPFTIEQITVAYTEHLPPPPNIVRRVDRRWAEFMAEARRDGRTLFNAPVACLKSFSTAAGILYLELAQTDYKTFLVTTLRDRAWFEANSPAAMTPALGNSILLTHGDIAYLGMRSNRVAAYPRWAHLFGGVLDWPTRANSAAEILLEHLYKELEEELGLTIDDLTAPPTLLAVMRDPVLAQPELAWHGELKQPLMLRLDALNVEEHDTILALPMAGVLTAGPPATPVSWAAIDRVRQLSDNGLL